MSAALDLAARRVNVAAAMMLPNSSGALPAASTIATTA
jgi:hypothetical protein